MGRWTIRRAGPPDLDTICAFNQALAEETEGRALDAGRVRAGTSAALADPARAFYLLAVSAAREVVGQLMVTLEWSDWRDGFFWWIQSVYVAPAARRQGVYRALYAHLVGQAEAEAGVCGVRLYVDADNRAAQQTYGALGMRRTAYQLYERDFVLPTREHDGS